MYVQYICNFLKHEQVLILYISYRIDGLGLVDIFQSTTVRNRFKS